MTDAPLPSEISRKDFEVVRRGFDQNQVRGFLHEIAALVERLQRAEADLTERVTKAEARLATAEHPDEHSMLELLGEETTRVLTSARDAAADIRAKGEQAAERMIAEATAQAAQTRSGAVAEADKRLVEARAEAEKLHTAARGELERRTREAEEAADRIRAEAASQAQTTRDDVQRDLAAGREEAAALVEAARTEGREMVAEAQAVRERILRDLSAKRKKARQQIELLNVGRERLLEAYAVVRSTVDAATEELNSSVNDARMAAAAAARRIRSEADRSPDEIDADLMTGPLEELPIAVVRQGGVAPAPPPQGLPEVEEPAVHEPGGDEPGGDEPGVEDAPEPAPPPSRLAVTPEPRVAPVRSGPVTPPPAADAFDPIDAPIPPPPPAAVAAEPAPSPAVDAVVRPVVESAPELGPEPATEPRPEPATEPRPEPDPAPAPERPSTAVFARLHQDLSGPEEPEADGTTEDDETPEPEPADLAAEQQAFTDRSTATLAIEKDLGRRLKRTLADEQNEVLDRLRRTKPKGIEDLLPSVEEHTGRWAEVSVAVLKEAATAGARHSGGKAGPTTDLADELAHSVVLPLRERIERSFVASDGNLDDVADRVRALYREWKNQRLTETVPHWVAAAYARGHFEGMPQGSKVQWAVDPAQGPCPDCDDNVLAGAIVKGEEFPTGNPCAPAHPGCRCLVLLVAG